MPLVAPNLDKRTFEQLVAEVRRRIPTFTPEWTDLNESDPGITLAQLFAFMSEQLLFQVNQVPDKGLITFLKMVGAELHPATPAVADVTFTPLLGSASPTIPIAARTQVQTAGPPPGEKTAITFETTKAFFALNGSITDLGSTDCDMTYRSHLAANKARSGTFAPFGAASTTRDAFYIVIDLDPKAQPDVWPADPVRLRVNLAGSTAVGEPIETSTTGVPPRIVWSYSSGTVVSGGEKIVAFTPFEPSLDSTLEFTRSGYLEFDFSTSGVVKRAANDVVPAALRGKFVFRAQIVRPGAYGASPPRLAGVLLNTIPARSLTTVSGEPLGRSTGLPFQRFRLARAPVFPSSTDVRVDETTEGGGANVAWHETLDLFSAGPNDRVYQLIPATGEILFGDGRFGKIPPPDDGSTDEGNVRVASYQYGGGFARNVGAATLTRVLGKPGGVSFDATNALPAAGGDDEETAAAGVARAPAVVRSRYRAVSAADFEALARETPDVRIARAHALANSRPNCRPGRSPGSVTIILVPNARFEDTITTPIDVPDHVTAAVLRYLDTRRLITTEVFARPATFRRVTVDATVRLGAGESLPATRTATLDALNRYFHALVGGDDGNGWPFGGTIFFSRVFERLLAVPGVELVERLAINVDDCISVTCRDAPINPGELLYSGVHTVQVRVPS